MAEGVVVPRAVLVTGVARPLGERVARLLAADPAGHAVVGVDVVAPRVHASDRGGRLPYTFVRADVRNPVISRVVEREGVDAVVHLAVPGPGATGALAGGRAAAKETAVLGTMQLLGACQRSPLVRTLVVESSAAVYGASPADPAVLTEDHEPRRPPRSGWARDLREVEGYVRGFRGRRPDIVTTVLRPAEVVGPGLRSPLTAYLSLPVVPVVLGHHARLQLAHVDDVVEAVRLALARDVPGPVHVAGDGVLLLSQAAGRAGRPVVPVPPPAVGTVGRLLRRAGLGDLPPYDELAYGRALDTTRMRRDLALEPRWTTPAALDALLHGAEATIRPGLLDTPRVDAAEAAVAAFLRRLAERGGARA